MDVPVSADDSPASFALDTSECRVAMRQVVAEAIAMRHLVEPVFCYFWPYFNGLEENIVTWIARHLPILPELRIT